MSASVQVLALSQTDRIKAEKRQIQNSYIKYGIAISKMNSFVMFPALKYGRESWTKEFTWLLRSAPANDEC